MAQESADETLGGAGTGHAGSNLTIYNANFTIHAIGSAQA